MSPFLRGIKGLATGLGEGLEARQKEGATQREAAYKHLLAKQMKGVPQALAPETAAYKTAQTEDIRVKQRQAAIDAKKKEFNQIADDWEAVVNPGTGKALAGREAEYVTKGALMINALGEHYKPGGKLFGQKGKTPAQDNYNRAMEAWVTDPTNGKKAQNLYAARAMLQKGTPETTKGLSAEAGSKLTMLQQALSDIDSVEKQLFTPEGKFLRGRAAAANIPGGRFPGIPSVGFGTQAREISSKINNALEAKLRIETGAAATQEEFNRLQDRFGVSAFDTAASAKNKLTRLKEFMKNAVVTLDPSGKFTYETGNQQLNKELNTPIQSQTEDPLGLR